MVKNRRRNKNKRRRNMVHDETSQFNGQISPSTTASIGVGQLNPYIQDRPFKFRKVVITAASLDVASANKNTFGPAMFQIRQYSNVPRVSGTTTLQEYTQIKSSRVFMVGPNPKTFYFTPIKYRYPAKCGLETFLALDCLCAVKGYEIGMHFSITIDIQVYHEQESESCPKVMLPMTSYAMSSEPGFELLQN